MLKKVVWILSCVIVVLSENSCNFNVNLKQNLRNEGFHRNLTYGIVFNGEDGEDMWLDDCLVALDQTLPPGVYANPDELGDLKRANRLNVIPKNRINIELPAEQAGPSGIYIVGKVADNRAYLWVPVHARYHRAVAGGGTARVQLPAPALLLRCARARLARCARAAPGSALCNGARDACAWRRLPYTMAAPAQPWRVPVGDAGRARAAAAGTALALLAGGTYLLRSLHQYSLKR